MSALDTTSPMLRAALEENKELHQELAREQSKAQELAQVAKQLGIDMGGLGVPGATSERGSVKLMKECDAMKLRMEELERQVAEKRALKKLMELKARYQQHQLYCAANATGPMPGHTAAPPGKATEEN